MSDPILLAGASLAGFLLGAFFFGGLFWTVRKGLTSERPALLFLASMLVRTAVVLAGFYWISRGSWQAYGMLLLGFLVARFSVVKWLAPVAAATRLESE